VPRERLRLVSHFPGRLRVRADAFRVLPEVAQQVVDTISAEPGVRAVTASPVTGSLLVVYEPRELQLPRLVQLLVSAGELGGIEVDAKEDWSKHPTQGTRVRETMGAWNDSLRKLTAGKVDLRTAVPGSLAATGAMMFLAGRRRIPEWYDLIFWAFVTFSNVNRPGEEPHADADPP
jgi:hypothetical protein